MPSGATSSPASGILAAASPRRPAALLLSAGGLLAGIGWFVPWVHVAWQAVDDEPAGTITVIPGRDLALAVLHTLQTPRMFTIETLCGLVFAWGVPLLLVALGIVALLAPYRGAPSRRARMIAGILTVCAAGWVMLVTLLSLTVHLEVIATTNTLQAGPVLALVGYGCALGGLIWLAPQRSRFAPGA